MKGGTVERAKIKKATKKSVFEMNWDEFVEYMNSDEVNERWEKAMEEAREKELESKKAASDFWVVKN